MLKTWYALIIIFLAGCTEIDLSGDWEVETSKLSVAVPIIHSSLSIPAISEASDWSGNLVVLEDGTVQVNYTGDVLRQSSLQMFPPVPGLEGIPITDTMAWIALPLGNGDIIDKAVIGQTRIYFSFHIPYKEIVETEIRIPQLTKNGEIFKVAFSVDNRLGENSVFESQAIPVAGYTLEPDNNSFLLIYDTHLPSGQRVELENVYMKFDLFTFTYLEGLFGSRTFDVRGDVITIDIFDHWISGGVEFLNPKVTIDVQNSFGLKARSKFNMMDIITVDGRNLQLESSLLEEGIDFDFPSLEEVGQVASTRVEFNAQNSNIGELFAQRANKVTYDIDALINAEDHDFRGFLTDSSYFRVQAEVNLPIEGTVTDLTLEDTRDLDLQEFDQVSSVELKVNIFNTYPMDMALQVYLLDSLGIVRDSIFADKALSIPGASLDAEGLVDDGAAIEHVELLEEQKTEMLLKASRIRLQAHFDTGRYKRVVRLLSTYSLDIDLGAKISVK